MSRPSRRAAPILAVSAVLTLVVSALGPDLRPSRAQAQTGAEAEAEAEAIEDDDGPRPEDVGAALAPDRPSDGPARSSTTAVDADRIRDELREELRETLRREIKDELREELLGEIEDARGAPLEPAVAPIEDDGWAEEGWKWEEPVRPELNLLELDGYFRFRFDFFNNLDLDTYYNRGSPDGTELQQGPFVPGLTSPPVPLCETDVRDRGELREGVEDPRPAAPSCANRPGEGSDLAGANIRFRLSPTLNVYEDIQIHAQVDILDNLILGSTPDAVTSVISPLAFLSGTQISPTAGFNTVLRDSIRVKRVWAEVMTPLGELSFGRMPNHVGMGILANDGNGLDQDFGDTVDRIAFATQIGDFLIAPAFDWAASGATSVNPVLPQGQPFDRDEADDVYQYVLTVSKQDSPEVIARKLANDEVTLDFGTQQTYRTQTLDSLLDSSPEGQATTQDIVERDAWMWKYTWWATLRWRDLTVSAEYAGIVGRIDDIDDRPAEDETRPYGGPSRRVLLNQHGGALRLSYKLLDDALTIELLGVAATGDGAPGWGVFPLYDYDQRGPGSWDGTQARDGSITNFRFDPDFIVDLIFWRQLVGLVTDALVVRPSIQYDLTKQLGGRLDIIYSRSWFGSSTPSGGLPGIQDLGGPDENLGIEADVTLYYRSEEGFNARLQYGVFFPMDGLDRLNLVEPGLGDTTIPGAGDVVRADASIAHTIQVLLGVVY